MTPESHTWQVRGLAVIGALAPFNIEIPDGSWTPLLLRPLLTAALALSLAVWLTSRQRRAINLLEVLVLTWLSAVWLSAAMSDNAMIGSAGAIRMTMVGMLLLAVASACRSRADAELVLKGLAVGVVVAILYGFGVLASGGFGFGSDHFFGGTTRLGPHLRFTQPWSHANVAGMALATIVGPLLLAGRRIRPRLAVPVGAIVITALVLTYSRGAMISAGAAGAVLISLHRPRPWRVAVSAVALVLVVAALSPGWSTRLTQPGLAGFYGVEISAPARVDLARTGLTPATISVTNTSTVAWAASGEDAVIISARWIERAPNLVWAEHTFELPNELPPGESITLDVQLQAIVPAGIYDVYWDLLRDDDAYFEQFSGKSTISVGTVSASTVTPASASPKELVPRALGLERREIWSFAWTAFRDKPLLGVGPSQIGLEFIEQRGEAQFVPGHHSHNVPLEALSTWGLAGAVPFFILIGSSIVLAWRRAFESRLLVDIIVSSALIGLVVHGLVDWPLIHTSTAILSAIILGLAWISLDGLAMTDEMARTLRRGDRPPAEDQ